MEINFVTLTYLDNLSDYELNLAPTTSEPLESPIPMRKPRSLQTTASTMDALDTLVQEDDDESHFGSIAGPGAYIINQIDDHNTTERRVTPHAKGQELGSGEPGPAIADSEEQSVMQASVCIADSLAEDTERTQLDSEYKPDSDSKQINNEPKSSFSRSRRVLTTIVLCLFTVTGVIFGVVFGITNRNGSMNMPSAAPTAVLGFTASDAMSLLSRRCPLTFFDDPSSPQSQALEWLVSDAYIQSLVGDTQDDSSNRLVQRFALATLWYSTTGDSWDAGDNWLEPIGECEWDHLVCDGESGSKVVEISMQSNNLVGELPHEIFILLVNLEVLDLSNNDLASMPNVMAGDISGLRVLKLRGNQLIGSIPEAIGSLSTLEHLDLSHNPLTGSIPSTLQATALQILQLRSIILTGTIPDELFRLRELREIELFSTNLAGTVSTAIGTLTKLSHLILSDNLLTGRLPTQLGLLSELSFLAMDTNYLTGTFITELGKLSALTSLYLSRNRITGTVPASLGHLVRLTGLDFFGNDLSGTYPGELVNLTKLDKHFIHRNKISGSIPSLMCSHVTPQVDCDEIACECCICHDLASEYKLLGSNRNPN